METAQTRERVIPKLSAGVPRVEMLIAFVLVLSALVVSSGFCRSDLDFIRTVSGVYIIASPYVESISQARCISSRESGFITIYWPIA